jgi:hypothetical protein
MFLAEVYRGEKNGMPQHDYIDDPAKLKKGDIFRDNTFGAGACWQIALDDPVERDGYWQIKADIVVFK